jgi:hypothetical protein
MAGDFSAFERLTAPPPTRNAQQRLVHSHSLSGDDKMRDLDHGWAIPCAR